MYKKIKAADLQEGDIVVARKGDRYHRVYVENVVEDSIIGSVSAVFEDGHFRYKRADENTVDLLDFDELYQCDHYDEAGRLMYSLANRDPQNFDDREAKVKILGRKQKVYFLRGDDMIEYGDMFVLINDIYDRGEYFQEFLTKDEMIEYTAKRKIREVYAHARHKANEYPNMIFFRIK